MAENPGMQGREVGDDEAFAERVAAPLRAAERAHPSFEKRVMDRVRMEGPTLYPIPGSSPASWWWTKRVFETSPMKALAVAAAVTAIVGLSGIALGTRIGDGRREVARAVATTAAPDTIQLVRFVFVDARASSVELVGDFNEWTKGTTTLRLSGAPGVWAASVPLTPGRHEYAFIVNGTRWVADPLAVKSSDDFGTESSVIRVAQPGRSET
jgi:hypothetical protein